MPESTQSMRRRVDRLESSAEVVSTFGKPGTHYYPELTKDDVVEQLLTITGCGLWPAFPELFDALPAEIQADIKAFTETGVVSDG